MRKTTFLKQIVGIITSLLVGWAFLWLIASYFHLVYWTMFVTAVLIANFFPLLYYEILSTEGNGQSKEEREFDIELMSFFIGIFAFGVEGVIISFFRGGGIGGLIGIACVGIGFVLSRMYKEPAAIILIASLFLAIPGYILGLFYGWTLGFLGMIHFLAALASVIMITLLDSVIKSEV